MNDPKNLSKEDLVKAYHISAKLVVEYGADFVPAFERIEQELERSEKLDETVARAEHAVTAKAQRQKNEAGS